MQPTFVVLHEGITKPRMKAQQIKNAKRDASTTGAGAGAGVRAGDDGGPKFRSGFGCGSKPAKGMRGGRGKGK